jgi:hypothetical protein
MCIKAKAANTKGSTKCKAKNLFKVALLTEHLGWQSPYLILIKYSHYTQ